MEKSWSNLFEGSIDPSMEYFPPNRTEGSIRVKPPVGVFEEGEQQWSNALVAQFLGAIPNLSAFQKTVNLLWGNGKEIDLRPAGKNLFIIQFPDEAARDKVLEGGPWYIKGQFLVLQKWEAGMETLELNLSRLPVWIQFSNIPLELFTKTGLSYIASAVGIPLYCDKITAYQKRLAFARICVEIDVSDNIPEVIEVEMKNGNIVYVYTKVSWLPQKYWKCKIFGHSDKSCVKKEVGKWVPKDPKYIEVIGPTNS